MERLPSGFLPTANAAIVQRFGLPLLSKGGTIDMPSLIAGSPPARPLGSGQQAPLRGLVPRESLFERLSAAAGR